MNVIGLGEETGGRTLDVTVMANCWTFGVWWGRGDSERQVTFCLGPLGVRLWWVRRSVRRCRDCGYTEARACPDDGSAW